MQSPRERITGVTPRKEPGIHSQLNEAVLGDLSNSSSLFFHQQMTWSLPSRISRHTDLDGLPHRSGHAKPTMALSRGKRARRTGWCRSCRSCRLEWTTRNSMWFFFDFPQKNWVACVTGWGPHFQIILIYKLFHAPNKASSGPNTKSHISQEELFIKGRRSI